MVRLQLSEQPNITVSQLADREEFLPEVATGTGGDMTAADH